MNSGETKLKEIMEDRIERLYVEDKLKDVVEDFIKYDLVSMPVVDSQEKIVGIVVIHDLMDEVMN